MVKIIVLTSQLVLVSQIDEVSSELGEPDCKLTEPFIIGDDDVLVPWLMNYTSQNTFMLSSDKILTLTAPKPTLLEKYENLTK